MGHVARQKSVPSSARPARTLQHFRPTAFASGMPRSCPTAAFQPTTSPLMATANVGSGEAQSRLAGGGGARGPTGGVLARGGQGTREGRDWFRRYRDGPGEVPVTLTEAFGPIAHEHPVHLVVGVVER